MSNLEKTLSIIKPDAVERNLDDEIKEIFIRKGFLISSSKFLSTASGFIIDNVFSKLLIMIFNKLIKQSHSITGCST
jgi:nucleoside diphosphate kinase